MKNGSIKLKSKMSFSVGKGAKHESEIGGNWLERETKNNKCKLNNFNLSEHIKSISNVSRDVSKN